MDLDTLEHEVRTRGLEVPLSLGIIVAVLSGDLSLACACIMSYVMVRVGG
jgi:hypothetical protein